MQAPLPYVSPCGSSDEGTAAGPWPLLSCPACPSAPGLEQPAPHLRVRGAPALAGGRQHGRGDAARVAGPAVSDRGPGPAASVSLLRCLARPLPYHPCPAPSLQHSPSCCPAAVCSALVCLPHRMPLLLAAAARSPRARASACPPSARALPSSQGLDPRALSRHPKAPHWVGRCDVTVTSARLSLATGCP